MTPMDTAIQSARRAVEAMRPKGFLVCRGLPIAALDDLHYVENEAKGREMFGSAWKWPGFNHHATYFLTPALRAWVDEVSR